MNSSAQIQNDSFYILRGKALCVAIIVNFGANLVVTFLFPVEIQLIGTVIPYNPELLSYIVMMLYCTASSYGSGGSTSFLIFAAIDLYAIIFIYYKVSNNWKGASVTPYLA